MVRKYSFLFIVIAAILWSLDGFLRRTLYTLPSPVIVFYEHLIGFGLIFPFIVTQLKMIKQFNRAEWGAFAWISLLSGVGGTLMYTQALSRVNYISFSVVVLLQQLQPLFVIGTARLLLKERITKSYFVWAIAALTGAYLLSFPKLRVNFTQNREETTAALLAIGAAFAWGSSTAFSRFALSNYPVMLTTGIRFLLTIPLAFVAIFIMGNSPSLTAINSNQLTTLVFIALSTGLIAMLIYYRGLKYTRAKISAIAELTWPLSAVIIGFFLFSERLTLTQIIGSMILLISMYRVGLRDQKDTTPIVYKVRRTTGKGRGKKIGIPTINFQIPPELTLPHGIYAGWLYEGKSKYPAAIHFGPRPVFTESDPSLEAFLLDGVIPKMSENHRLEITAFIRPVKQFPTIRDMLIQIDNDIKKIKTILKLKTT